jgi:hypothetical protein
LFKYHGARSRQKVAAVFFCKSKKIILAAAQERGAFDPPCDSMKF